jgi:hypothetical protein
VKNDSFLLLFYIVLETLSSPCSQNFLMMRARPQTPMVGKKKKFSLFLGFDFDY